MSTSADGVVTATVDTATASVLLTVDFTVAGSPIHSTAATTVYAIMVTEQTSGQIVRGLSSAPAPGGVAAGIDHEAEIAVGLSYVAQAFGSTGSVLATSAPATITLPSPVGGAAAWLKSLSAPAMSVTVDLPPDTALQWDSDIAEGVIRVIGRADPIVVQDVRQLPTASLDLLTETTAAATALDALLRTPGPYLLQMPGYGEPDRYVTVSRTSPRRLPGALVTEPSRRWTLPLTQVTRPDPTGWSVAIPGKTYGDSAANLPLYSNRTGTYLSRSQ